MLSIFRNQRSAMATSVHPRRDHGQVLRSATPSLSRHTQLGQHPFAEHLQEPVLGLADVVQVDVRRSPARPGWRCARRGRPGRRRQTPPAPRPRSGPPSTRRRTPRRGRGPSRSAGRRCSTATARTRWPGPPPVCRRELRCTWQTSGPAPPAVPVGVDHLPGRWSAGWGDRWPARRPSHPTQAAVSTLTAVPISLEVGSPAGSRLGPGPR